jgi:predicted Rossmann fold flavoprotein
VIATGSNPKIWELMQHEFQHQIIKPVPSLFTFNCNDPFLADLAGISAYVSVSVAQTKLQEVGNLLITHKGFSGPAVLKLSAWGARILADLSYNFTFVVNWLHQTETSEAITQLKAIKQQDSKKTISKKSPFEFPNRLWERFVLAARINDQKKWADITNVEIEKLAQLLTKSEFKIKEKSTFKEEFVTAGGLDLKEINFKTMQSKRHDNLYFAGETVNIDAITGGFNFQNAWTTGFLVSQSI